MDHGAIVKRKYSQFVERPRINDDDGLIKRSEGADRGTVEGVT